MEHVETIQIYAQMMSICEEEKPWTKLLKRDNLDDANQQPSQEFVSRLIYQDENVDNQQRNWVSFHIDFEKIQKEIQENLYDEIQENLYDEINCQKSLKNKTIEKQ